MQIIYIHANISLTGYECVYQKLPIFSKYCFRFFKILFEGAGNERKTEKGRLFTKLTKDNNGITGDHYYLCHTNITCHHSIIYQFTLLCLE